MHLGGGATAMQHTRAGGRAGGYTWGLGVYKHLRPACEWGLVVRRCASAQALQEAVKWHWGKPRHQVHLQHCSVFNVLQGTAAVNPDSFTMHFNV